MENTLVRSEVILTFEESVRMAQAIFESNIYKKDVLNANVALVKIIAGKEFGIGPTAAMNGIYLAPGGLPALKANLMGALIKKSGKYNYRVREHTNEGCVIEWFEDKQPVGTSSFTKEDAQRAGLLGKDAWQKYPKDVYFARALSRGARWYCPDALNGHTPYTPEELESVDNANIIEGEARVVVAVNKPTALPKQESVQKVVALFSDEDIGWVQVPDKLAMFEKLANEMGYDVSIAQVDENLAHLVGATNLATLPYKKAKLLVNYFKFQKGKDGEELKAAKSLGKIVLARCVASGETWEVALENSKQVVTEEIPSLEKVL